MKVLLVDDDRDLVDLLRYSFQRDGYNVILAFDGEMAARVFELEMPDLVVLDLIMPKRSGMDVLKKIRDLSEVPIIVLTGVGDEDHLVNALELGADDYLVKPFRPRELRARARALLRRNKARGDSHVKPTKPLIVGSLTLDPLTRQVSIGEKGLQLSSKEFALLHYLMLNRDVVLKVSDIMENVWGFDSPANDEVLKVTIYRLRHKIEADPAHPQYIINLPGQGYTFRYKAKE